MTGEIKAVTFDLWQTILLEKDGNSAQRNSIRCSNLSRAFAELGTQVSAMYLNSVLKELTSWLKNIWMMDKDVSHLDQIKFIARQVLGDSLSLDEKMLKKLSIAYVSPIFELPPYLDSVTHSVLQWLKEQGKEIGLISNVGMTPGFALRKFLEMEGVSNYFTTMTFSDEAGVRKPNPSIFNMTAIKLNSRPGEIVHIGDDIRSDVWGAKNAGFKVIYLESKIGYDKIAERDPTSLVWFMRQLSKDIRKDEVVADRTVASLEQVIAAIEQIDI
jgi:putative hydrolase of the HAD superfamily